IFRLYLKNKVLLLCFAHHRRTSRGLHFEPVGRATGAIHRVPALRHDAFESHLAGVSEDGRAVAFYVLVEPDAGGALATTDTSVALRTSSGSRRMSSPLSSFRSKA